MAADAQLRAVALCALLVLAACTAAFVPLATGSDGSAGSVAVLSGSASPSTVPVNTTVPGQRVTVYVAGVSADGEPDTHYVAFPNSLATNVSLGDTAVAGNATVTETRLVDGFDEDGVVETVAVQTNATGNGTVSLAITVNVSVTYPDRATRYAIHARTVDSSGANATKRGVATITAVEPKAAGAENRTVSRPVITDFRLNATEQDVDVVVTSTEDLEKLKVKVKGKVKNVTLTRADFRSTTRPPKHQPRLVYDQDVDVYLNNTSTGDIGKLKVKVKSKVKKIEFAGDLPPSQQQQYVYRADVSDGQDGTFHAELLEASAGGKNATVGHTDDLTVQTGPDQERIVVFLSGAGIGGGVVAAWALLRSAGR